MTSTINAATRSLSAAGHAADYCSKHPKWQRICDIESSDALMLRWEELSRKTRAYWESGRRGGKEAWEEFGSRPCRVDWGCIDENGTFWRRCNCPPDLNSMMIFMTGGRQGRFYREPRGRRLF